MATTSRGWRKVADNENDKAQAVNDALDDASADVTSIANVAAAASSTAAAASDKADAASNQAGAAAAQAAAADARAQAALSNGGEGNGGATETSVTVPANRIEWTDTGITLDNEVLILEASGEISHGAGVAPYGAYNQGGAYLVWTLVTDGTTPVGNVPSQIDYRVLRTAHKRSGRLWLHVRDAGGAGDNSGSFTVKVRRWANLVSVLAPLSELAGLRDSLSVLSSRVSALEQTQSSG